jgi:hypothetical protein
VEPPVTSLLSGQGRGRGSPTRRAHPGRSDASCRKSAGNASTKHRARPYRIGEGSRARLCPHPAPACQAPRVEAHPATVSGRSPEVLYVGTTKFPLGKGRGAPVGESVPLGAEGIRGRSSPWLKELVLSVVLRVLRRSRRAGRNAQRVVQGGYTAKRARGWCSCCHRIGGENDSPPA